MYNYEDIKIQNKCQQVYSMYASISRNIMKRCGDKTGERIIRKAVRKTGTQIGQEILEKHRKDGMKTNLHNLYFHGLNILFDPRTRIKTIFDFEDRQNFEVHTCPFAHFHTMQGEGKMGSFFCDEFQYAVVLAYTENMGQLNLSKMLTYDNDDFCCISSYFRPSNVGEQRAKESFTSMEPLADLVAPQEERKRESGDIAKFAVQLYCNFFYEAEESCGNEGVCAVCDGLKDWAEDAIKQLRKNASDTGCQYNEEFVKKNFPLNLYVEYENDGLCPDGQANKVMTNLVLNEIRKSF